MGDIRAPLIASGFFKMENDPGQSAINDTTKGVDDLGTSSTGVGCLTVVYDPGTSSVSGGISPRDSSLEHYHQLLVVQQRWTILEHPQQLVTPQQSRRPKSILSNRWFPISPWSSNFHVNPALAGWLKDTVGVEASETRSLLHENGVVVEHD